MNRKHNKFCTTLNYFERFVVLASAITAYISMFVFRIRITSSAIELKTCVIAAEIKRYISQIKKKKKKYDKIELLANLDYVA